MKLLKYFIALTVALPVFGFSESLSDSMLLSKSMLDGIFSVPGVIMSVLAITLSLVVIILLVTQFILYRTFLLIEEKSRMCHKFIFGLLLLIPFALIILFGTEDLPLCVGVAILVMNAAWILPGSLDKQFFGNIEALEKIRSLKILGWLLLVPFVNVVAIIIYMFKLTRFKKQYLTLSAT
jgi:hypothetical protein